ncbi:hypothetical protein [Bdellovibrio sp. KM01]|uniref:hypothetical protein n=1 Tax=Bdellovibrio sp. KM01 TaxID=2748865 RepID=UPI0015EA1EE2|nr:hypothetical protein [Bdellovibrio sp. KM01]QLY25155.1 hypothetical protein HW988_17320 [Bdellovibrio sp. KM01]
MKRLALPVIGALICLQFTAGCLDTGHSKSGVRVAKGSMNGKTAKEAKRIAEQSAIKEEDFNFQDDDAYRNYIDPVVSNLKVNGDDSIGFVKTITSRKWSVLSLYNKTAPADVFFIPQVKASKDPNDKSTLVLAWISPTKLQIDKSTYESYLTEQKGGILMRFIMTVLRLETKGQLAAYSAQAQLATASLSDELVEAMSQDIQDDDQAEANKIAAQSESDEESEGASKDDTVASIVSDGGKRKGSPVDKCKEETDQPQLPECVKRQQDVNEKRRKALLDKTDMENIEKAADYMILNGRNAKVSDIKAKLKELTIIK